MGVVFCYSPWEKYLMENNRGIGNILKDSVPPKCHVAIASTMEDLKGEFESEKSFR